MELWNIFGNLMNAYIDAYARDKNGNLLNAQSRGIYKILQEECKDKVVHYWVMHGMSPKWIDHDKLEEDVAEARRRNQSR